MRKGDDQLGKPDRYFMGVKATIESTFAVEGMKAYATDTHMPGYYDGSAWVWGAGGVSGSSGGDMMKSVYDTDNDGIVDNSEALETHPASYFATSDHVHPTVSGSNLITVLDDDSTDLLLAPGFSFQNEDLIRFLSFNGYNDTPSGTSAVGNLMLKKLYKGNFAEERATLYLRSYTVGATGTSYTDTYGTELRIYSWYGGGKIQSTEQFEAPTYLVPNRTSSLSGTSGYVTLENINDSLYGVSNTFTVGAFVDRISLDYKSGFPSEAFTETQVETYFPSVELPDASTPYIDWFVPLPASWYGKTIKAYIYWVKNSAATGNVYLGVSLNAQEVGGALSTPSPSMGTSGPFTALGSNELSRSEIDLGELIGSTHPPYSAVRLTRYGSNVGDTLAAPVLFLGMELIAEP